MIFSGQLTVADHKTHVPLTFVVPPGTIRLTGKFRTNPDREPGALFDTMVCLSLFGPNGPRGARHNNPDRDFCIEPGWASPGYLPGSIEQGTWTVFLDCFRVLGTVDYRLEISCETAGAPQPDAACDGEDRPVNAGSGAGRVMARHAVASVDLPGPLGWYRGDLHAHTLHSDASWDVPDLVSWAQARGLDFVTLTDHNTTAGHAAFHTLAADKLLSIGGMELTTHWGHALSLGGTALPEWRVGAVTGRSMPMLAKDIIDSGALFVIAHPMSPGDPSCTGCRWDYTDMRPGNARLVEVWNGGPWSDYNEEGLALFQHWLALGHRLYATAGSDIHGPEGGVGEIGFNHVQAEARSPAAILKAVNQGRNYLSSGPQLILTAQTPAGRIAAMGDTVPTGSAFHAAWKTGSDALMLHFVDANGRQQSQPVPAGTAGAASLSQVRGFVMAELRDDHGRLHAVTNPIFLQ